MGQFASFTEFWQMGGYGFFVWLAFGATLAAMVVMTWFSLKNKKRLFKQILNEDARRQRIRQARGESL